MKQRIKFSKCNTMTKYWNTSLVFFFKIKGFGGPQGQGGGEVVMLFHMKELQLRLHKYMKNKALIINFIFSVSVNVHPRW